MSELDLLAPFDPVEIRPELYDFLFAGELPHAPLPDVNRIGLSGLCRSTRRSGNRSPELREHLDDIPMIVGEILAEQDFAARQPDGQAVFSFLDGESREVVAGIVSDIFTQWEVTNSKHGVGKLVASRAEPAKWLVVETAAAVMSVAGPELGFNIRKYSTDRKYLAKIIYSWGPGFARQWLDGTIVDRWTEDCSMDQDQKARWSKILSNDNLKKIAACNMNDPIKALDDLKFNLDTALSSESIAQKFGWTVEEAEDFFKPTLRTEVGLGSSNIDAALTRIKFNLDHVLTDNNIAEILECSPQEAALFITPGIRKTLACKHKNPAEALNTLQHEMRKTMSDSSLAKLTGWPEDKVNSIFTPAMRRRIAFNNINTAAAVTTFAHNLDVVLSDANLVELTGWPVEQVKEMFPPSYRVRFAIGTMDDPLRGCAEWLLSKSKQGALIDAARDAKLARIASLKP